MVVLCLCKIKITITITEENIFIQLKTISPKVILEGFLVTWVSFSFLFLVATNSSWVHWFVMLDTSFVEFPHTAFSEVLRTLAASVTYCWCITIHQWTTV